jgi:hypothetical protein
MAFLALRETVRELMRQVTRGGTPAGLQLMTHCRELSVIVSVPQFLATLRRTVQLREEDELLLHAFLDPFDTGDISWKEFIDWVRRPPAADGAAATERRVRRTMETCLRVCVALRRKLVLTRDGDYDFATTFRHVAQRTGSTHGGNRQDEHFIPCVVIAVRATTLLSRRLCQLWRRLILSLLA